MLPPEADISRIDPPKSIAPVAKSWVYLAEIVAISAYAVGSAFSSSSSVLCVAGRML